MSEQSIPYEYPDEHELTTEEIAALEAEREASEQAKIAPCRTAAQQRQHSADVIAEHDDLLADMLYEMTISAIGTEV